MKLPNAFFLFLRSLTVVVIVIGLWVLTPTRVDACTTFYMAADGGIVGKSYDWDIGRGLVVVNKRGVSKHAVVGNSKEVPAKWTSKYGSITFNQYGVEFPQGGMNEAGLVVEIMWLESSVYPEPDARPAVNELQWIQYALDNFDRVAQLVAKAPQLRISKAYASVHYLACDRTGECAAFEYLDGKLTIAQGEGLPAKTLTNDTYDESAQFLKKHVGFGGDAPIPKSNGSLDRFVRASSMALSNGDGSGKDRAFAILDSVATAGYSKWNIVYVMNKGEVYFRTHYSPVQKRVSMKSVNFDCAEPSMVMNIDTTKAGDVSGLFKPYTYEVNRDLIKGSTAPIANHLPPGAVDALARFPEKLQCTEGKKQAVEKKPTVSAGPDKSKKHAAPKHATTETQSRGTCSFTPSARTGPSLLELWELLRK